MNLDPNQNNNGTQQDGVQTPTQAPGMPQQPAAPTDTGMGGGVQTPPAGVMGQPEPVVPTEPTAPVAPATEDTGVTGGMNEPTAPLGGTEAPAAPSGAPGTGAPLGGETPMGGAMPTGGTAPTGAPQGQPGDDQSGATE